MKSLLRWFPLAAALAMSWPVLAQDAGLSRKQQMKLQEKKEKEREKERLSKEKEARRRHMAIQDKPTQKRLKRQNRRADAQGSRGHRDPWHRRVLTRKR